MRKRLTFLTIFTLTGFCISPLIWASPKDSQLNSYLFQRGVTQYEREQYIAAVETFSEVILADQNTLVAHEYLANRNPF